MSSLSVHSIIEQAKKVASPRAKFTGYNLRLVRNRLAIIRAAREHEDPRELLFVINEGVHGNLGSIGNADLFKRANQQEKALIREYFAEISLALQDLAETKSPDISTAEKIDLFRRASQCYGDSALMLSGAGSLTPYHIGVVQALYENDLLPRVISGSSGGSLIAGMLGTRSPEELRDIFDNQDVFKLINDTLTNLEGHMPTEKKWGGLLPVLYTEDILRRIVDTWIPDLTFSEAYERSGLAINVSITPSTIVGSSRLLNAITSPNVYIREAVRASCSVPGVFPPVELRAKGYDGQRRPYIRGEKWVDGSVGLDLPSRRLGRLYRVNHFITSQTNPAVLWAVRGASNAGPHGRRVIEWASEIFRANLKALQPVTSAITGRFPWVKSVNHLFYSVAGQEYTADINILPAKRVLKIHEVMSPITQEQAEALVNDGKNQTLAQIELIRNCTMISKTLTKILQKYKQPLM